LPELAKEKGNSKNEPVALKIRRRGWLGVGDSGKFGGRSDRDEGSKSRYRERERGNDCSESAHKFTQQKKKKKKKKGGKKYIYRVGKQGKALGR